MSTRATIIVKKEDYYNPNNPNNGLHTLQYYHHWDGYTSGLGLELMQKLMELNGEKVFKSITDAEFFFKRNFSLEYDKERPEDLHGDIEYLYEIDIKKDAIELRRFKRGDWDKEEQENYPKWKDIYLLLRLKARPERDFYTIDSLYFDSSID